MLRFGLAAIAILLPAVANGQYSMIGTPLQNGGSSYYSNINLGWGISGNGWSFGWNGGNTNPQFGPGGANPAVAQIGGGFGGGGLSGGFNLTAGQGADTNLGTQAASVTVMNGAQGYFADSTIRPFVTGFVPVVGSGGGVYTASPLKDKVARYQALREAAKSAASAPAAEERAAPQPVAIVEPPRASSAERGAPSLAEIRAGQANPQAEQDRELAELLSKAADAESKGQNVTARILYQQAQRRATGELKAEIAAKLQVLAAGKR